MDCWPKKWLFQRGGCYWMLDCILRKCVQAQDVK